MSIKHLLIVLVSLIVSSPAFAVEAEKEWNFLIFLNGVNDLDSFGAMNINQMEEVGSSADINVLVQWGSAARLSVQRLFIQKDNDKTNVTSPVVQDLGLADMGNPNQLVDFVQWAQLNYPAKRYFVVIWNHGSGWHSIMSGGQRVLDISFDDRSGNSMTTLELGQAMRAISKNLGRKVDVYASDACLMGMIEVADEMADSVQYFMGSQDYEPGAGWSYATLLNRWNNGGPQQSTKWVVQEISKDFLAAYSGGVYGTDRVTMSAFDLTMIEPLKQSILEIKQQLMALPPISLAKVLEDGQKSKSFTEDYYDLQDFLNKSSQVHLSSKLQTDFQTNMANFVIANDQNQDTNTFGVSIWLPTSAVDLNSYMHIYKGLNFDKTTGWSDLLQSLNP